jgi:hypothetical protein
VEFCSTLDLLASAGFSSARTFQVRWPVSSGQDGYFSRPYCSSMVGRDPHAPTFQFFCFCVCGLQLFSPVSEGADLSLWKSSVTRKGPGEGACFTRAISDSRFLPVSVFWVSVCVCCIFLLVFTVYRLVAASNQVFLVLWVEILYLCSLRRPSGSVSRLWALNLFLVPCFYCLLLPWFVLLWRVVLMVRKERRRHCVQKNFN